MIVSHLKPNAAQRVSGPPDREFPCSEPRSTVVGLLSVNFSSEGKSNTSFAPYLSPYLVPLPFALLSNCEFAAEDSGALVRYIVASVPHVTVTWKKLWRLLCPSSHVDIRSLKTQHWTCWLMSLQQQRKMYFTSWKIRFLTAWGASLSARCYHFSQSAPRWTQTGPFSSVILRGDRVKQCTWGGIYYSGW